MQKQIKKKLRDNFKNFFEKTAKIGCVMDYSICRLKQSGTTTTSQLKPLENQDV